jgi:BNR/Asp-box repeat
LIEEDMPMPNDLTPKTSPVRSYVKVIVLSLVAAFFFGFVLLDRHASDGLLSISSDLDGLAFTRIFRTSSDDDDDDNDDEIATHTLKATATGLFSSTDGETVVAADMSGHLLISHDYGATFKTTRPLQLSSGKYATVYGLVMDEDGTKMMASTGTNNNFYSEDGGVTWEEMSDSPTCGKIAATSDLSGIVCIEGIDSSEETYVYYSKDYGESWSKADAGKGNWIGVVTASDFSRTVLLETGGWAYIATSDDMEFTANEGEANNWGCLAASSDATVLVMTDVDTGNAHGSFDGGDTWTNVYTNMWGDDQIIGPCMVNGDGTRIALGFTGASMKITKSFDATVKGFNPMSLVTKYVDQDGFPEGALFAASSSDFEYLYAIDDDDVVYAGTSTLKD